jgi:hypothetical protein
VFRALRELEATVVMLWQQKVRQALCCKYDSSGNIYLAGTVSIVLLIKKLSGRPVSEREHRAVR